LDESSDEDLLPVGVQAEVMSGEYEGFTCTIVNYDKELATYSIEVAGLLEEQQVTAEQLKVGSLATREVNLEIQDFEYDVREDQRVETILESWQYLCFKGLQYLHTKESSDRADTYEQACASARLNWAALLSLVWRKEMAGKEDYMEDYMEDYRAAHQCHGICHHYFGRGSCRYGAKCNLCHDDVHKGQIMEGNSSSSNRRRAGGRRWR
jgi:hypothetical protein